MVGAGRDEFEEFATATYPRLVRMAYLLTGDVANAEDLVQDTLVRTLRVWRRISRTEHVHRYVYRTMINAHISARRRRWWGEIPTASVPKVGWEDPFGASDDQDVLRADRPAPNPYHTKVISLVTGRVGAEPGSPLGALRIRSSSAVPPQHGGTPALQSHRTHPCSEQLQQP